MSNFSNDNDNTKASSDQDSSVAVALDQASSFAALFDDVGSEQLMGGSNGTNPNSNPADGSPIGTAHHSKVKHQGQGQTVEGSDAGVGRSGGTSARGGSGDGSGGGSRDGREDNNDSSMSGAELVTTVELTTIRDLEFNRPSTIPGALHYCKSQILSPYLVLLGVMGLKPSFSPEPQERGTFCLVLNKLYFVFIFSIVMAGYILQYLTCFRRDRGFLYKEELLEKNVTEIVANDEPSYEHPLHSICLGNPILIHVVPSLFHLSSFLYMVYLYRVHHDEQLPNLMERVFIQATYTRTQLASQKKLLHTLHCLLGCCIVWLTMSTACQLTLIFTHNIAFNFQMSKDVQRVLLGIMAFSTTWQDSLQVTVIISYGIHCILLSNYFNFLYARVQQQSITLHDCIKEIGELEKLTSYLNNDLSPGLGPLLILNAATAVSSVVFLASSGPNLGTWDLISVIVVTVLWVLLVTFPLIKAANLSTACRRIHEIGHLVRLRPFGYQATPQADLDSFLLFVSTLKMDVRIMNIPVSTPILACSFTFFAFALLCWGLFLSAIVFGHSLGVAEIN